MNETESDPEDDTEEFYILPEGAIQFLPEEWRNQIQAIADDGRTVLKSVDNELTQLVRLSHSFVNLVTLKHIQRRLLAYEFKPEVKAILELEMLTTAFVVAYVRLHEGGSGSGFSRGKLPQNLREVHDHIIELRNERFAHNGGHPSAESALEIGFEDDRFDIKLGFTLGYHVGGRTEWKELVQFLDAMFFYRLCNLATRLKEKTGRDWNYPAGEAPEDQML
jgi:hypothetical protein